MSHESEPSKDLASRLIAEDEGAQTSDANRDTIGFIIDQELQFERRVRRATIFAWSATFATLPILGAAMFVIDTGGGTFVDVARWSVAMVGSAGALSLLAAILTTLSWLFRSRTASLAAIERRLATLEEILLSR